MRIQDEVVIEAPVDVVWELTVDIEAWPEYIDTFVTVIRHDQGPLAVGSVATVKQRGQHPRTWTVTRLESPRLFEWKTRIFGTSMRAIHELDPVADGCRNRLVVEVAGLVGRLGGKQISRSIATENAGLKHRAEG